MARARRCIALCTPPDGSRSFQREYGINAKRAQSNVAGEWTGAAARYDPAVQRYTSGTGSSSSESPTTGKVSVRELAGELQRVDGVGTARPEFLEDQKSLARTHGGAVAHGVIYELPLRYRGGPPRAGEAADRRGGRDARGPRGRGGRADRRHDDDRGRALASSDRKQLTVVTNALNIATERSCGRPSSWWSPAASCASAPTSCAGRWPKRRWPG